MSQGMPLPFNKRSTQNSDCPLRLLYSLFCSLSTDIVPHPNAVGTLPRKDIVQYEKAYLTVLLLQLFRNTKLICR